MISSTYLEQSLYFDQSSSTDETLEKRACEIFEKLEANPFVEICVRIHDSNSSSPTSFNSQKGSVTLDVEAASSPSSPVDHCRFPGWEPPHYVGSHDLQRQYFSNSQELRNIVSVR